jgi:hypothetical protein
VPDTVRSVTCIKFVILVVTIVVDHISSSEAPAMCLF